MNYKERKKGRKGIVRGERKMASENARGREELFFYKILSIAMLNNILKISLVFPRTKVKLVLISS